MTRSIAADLAARLGAQAEAVCRHYLSNGRKQGGYWQVGDVRNTAGRSMFVRLQPGPKGPAGKWCDAATGEHGDLLDVIRETGGYLAFADTAREARRFLSLPHPDPGPRDDRSGPSGGTGSRDAVRRLWRMAEPVRGTLAETYLRARAITRIPGGASLRHHPRCFWKPKGGGPTETWPALIGAVTDANGCLTGLHRTWLARNGRGKASLDPPRKAMGDLLGHGVRFGGADDILAAGEGIETVLSAREVLPGMPMIAALSAAHLAALRLPPGLRRLYVLQDRGPAGAAARDGLLARATDAGIEAIALVPRAGDFNDDLCRFGADALRMDLTVQLHPEDVGRFSEG